MSVHVFTLIVELNEHIEIERIIHQMIKSVSSSTIKVEIGQVSKFKTELERNCL